MASEDEVSNLSACREVLGSVYLSNIKTNVEWNLCCACADHDSLMYQQVAAEDALEMAQLLHAERQSLEQIIVEQACRVQVVSLSQMQPQAMERVEAQEKELCGLSAL